MSVCKKRKREVSQNLEFMILESQNLEVNKKLEFNAKFLKSANILDSGF